MYYCRRNLYISDLADVEVLQAWVEEGVGLWGCILSKFTRSFGTILACHLPTTAEYKVHIDHMMPHVDHVISAFPMLLLPDLELSFLYCKIIIMYMISCDHVIN